MERSRCERAIELAPHSVVANENLGTVLMDKGQLDEAIVEHKKAIEIQPKLAAAHHNLGTALLGKGHVDEAIEYYKKAIALDPKLAPSHRPRCRSAAGRWP